MEQQDYLQRQIRQIAAILGKILSTLVGIKGKAGIHSGLDAVSQTLKGELNFDIQNVLKIPLTKFISSLKQTEGFDADNMEKLADILLIIAEREGGYKKKVLLERCRAIYEYLEISESVYSFAREEKIKRVKDAG